MGHGSPMSGHGSSGRPAPMAGRWPLRGREPALHRAMQALSRGQGCVLIGEPGVGKTRLAQEILEAARELGHPTRWVVATQAARSIAFGAVAHLLPAPGRDGNSPLGMLQRALAVLARSDVDRRLVLGVDDAHLLDDSSTALVHMAASVANVLVVVTARADGEASEPVTALWKDGLADRVELQPLERRHMITLAGDILGGSLDRQTEHLLWKATGGNPLYLRELLMSGLEGGHLRHVDDLWRWRGPLQVGSRLAEVIGGRLTGMSRDLRGALEIVAVAEHLELSLFEGFAGEPVVREAERRGVITIVSDGRRHGVRLLHPLYGEVLRQAVPQHRMRRILADLVEALEATGARRRGDLLRSCDWRVRAGLPVPDATLLAGTRLARETGDARLAERLLSLVDQDARSGQVRAAAARIEGIAGGMTGPLLPVVANHILGWSRGDARAIDVASQAYAELGAYLPAAEAATTAAQLHQSCGRRTAAAAAGARAAVLRERCAGCHTMLLDDAALPSPLTQRELEVTRLAARGLSNRRIAAELGISVRTVETHVQRAYSKLGVAGRSDLGPMLDT
jgi:DNA-binding CsgD family transcriptional regulator